MTLDEALARLAALEREVARLTGELDAAEQHVKILREEVARLAAHAMPDGLKCRDLGECLRQHEEVDELERAVARLRGER